MNSYVGGRLSGTIQSLGRETFTIMLFSVFLMLMVMGADVNLSVEQMTKFEEFLVKYGIDSTRGGLQNYGKPGGYRWWCRGHLRHLVPSEYDWNS